MLAKFDDKATSLHAGANVAPFYSYMLIIQQFSQSTVELQSKSILLCIETLLTCTESMKTLATQAAAALQAPLQGLFSKFSVFYAYAETFHIHASTVLSMFVRSYHTFVLRTFVQRTGRRSVVHVICKIEDQEY